MIDRAITHAGAVRVGATLICLLAGALVLLCTRAGPFTTIDSALYVELAHNLGTKGDFKGTLSLDAQIPPLYPATLSLAGFFGVDVLAFARSLHAVLFAGTAMLAGILVSRSLPGRPLFMILSLLWTATSVDLLIQYSGVLSEALFIFLVLCWILALSRYLEAPGLGRLLPAAVAAGLAVLTRYVGIATLVAAVPVLAFCKRLPMRRRLRDLIIHAAAGALPLAVWLVWSELLAALFVSRPPAFHPPDWSALAALVDVTSRWLLPRRVPLLLRAVGLGLVAAAGLALAARTESLQQCRASPRYAPVLVVSGWYLLSHCAILAGSRILFDADIAAARADLGRLLVPIYIPMLVAVVTVIALGWDRLSRAGWQRLSLLVAIAVVLSLHVTQAVYNVAKLQNDGLGFASTRWRQSAVVEHIRGLPADTIVYTNAPGALYLLGGRTSRVFPTKYDKISRRAAPNYPAEIEEMKLTLQQQKGVIVFFHEMAFPYFPSDDELAATLFLVPKTRDPVGSIYEVR